MKACCLLQLPFFIRQGVNVITFINFKVEKQEFEKSLTDSREYFEVG